MADLTEALIANTIDCFQSFPLQDLDEEWFNDLWINHFSSLEDYPSPGTEIFREELFEPISNAIEVCEKWIERSLESNSANPESETLTSSEEVLWTVLMDNCIDIKYVLGFIFAVCGKGIKPCAVRFEEEMALKCAKLYFTLLRIPGNSAYNVYYPSLLQLSFDCFKFPKEDLQGKKRSPPSVYRSEVMSKRKRIQRKDSLSDSPEELMDTDEGEVREQKCDDLLLKCFIDVLKSVIPLFETFSLSGNYELIAYITNKLSECVAIESRPIRLNLSRSGDEILKREFQRQNGLPNVVVALGYCAYLNICQALHGDVNEIYRLCLQSLCGHILCSKAKGQAILQKHIVVRDNALAFVCYNLKKNVTYSVEVSRILLQRLCIRCLDKADYRLQVASAIEKILACYPLKAYVEMIEWFVLFGTQKQQDKMIVLEIFSMLVMVPEREITPEITKEWAVYTTHIPLVFSIIERCDDKVPTVRAKALSVLANTLNRIREVISVGQRDFGLAGENEEIEAGSAKENEDNGKEDDAEHSEANNDEVNEDDGGKNGGGVNEAEGTEVKNAEAVTPPVKKEPEEHKPCESQFELCSVEQFVELLLIRSIDLKVHVRKFALQAIEYLLCLDEVYLTEKFLRFLSRATRDPNITVRKSSVCSLTIILHKYYDNSLVQKVYMKSVLPIVFDEEKSVQSKGLEQMEELFLLNYGNSSSMKHCAWTMLTEIACGDHNDLLRYLQKAYGIWKTEEKLKPNLSHLLEAQLGMEYDAAAWMLLSILSSNIEIKNITGIINRYKQSFETSVSTSTQMRMLQVLGNTCTHMKADQLEDLRTSLESQLSSFDCHFQLITTTIETLYKVYKAKYKRKNEPERLMNAFSSELMKPAEKFLTELVMDTNLTGEHSDDRISQYLQMVGDLAVVAPPSVPKTMLLILQSIIATTSTSKGINYGTSTSITVKVWRICPKIQAIALTTLGKLCLTNQKYPGKCLPIFIKELATSKSFMVRMNIVTVLADLCVRCTSAVDLYIPSMSGCLKDGNVNIRRQTLALISRLLQEDYIKLKDSLLYRLLSCLVDGDDDMRNMVEYCLGGLLAKKQPSIFFQHFVETIFYFNASAPLPRLKVNQSKQDTRLFALKGKNNFENRMTIYKFMVFHTPVIKRVLIVLKLAEDILNTSATLAIPINDSTEAVIKDALAVLSLDEFKPTQGHSNATDDNDETESTDSVTCKSLFRNTVISAIVPITITLKKTLSELKSPLTPDILQFIAETCKDYKNEVKSMFATDKAIVEEIEFITKKYEKELERKKRLNSSGIDEIEDDPQSPKPSSAVTPPKPDVTRSEDEHTHQFLISNGIDTTNKLVVLERVSVPNRESVNVADLFSGDGVWNPNRTDNNENSRHHQAMSDRIPLSETPILSHESSERNTVAGNITVCDIGNAEWDDGRHSVNTSRANTHRSRCTERSE